MNKGANLPYTFATPLSVPVPANFIPPSTAEPQESNQDPDLHFGWRWCALTRILRPIASLKFFIFVICACVVLQGILHGSFNRTIQIWAEQFGVEQRTADWVIVGNNIVQGIVTIFLIHGGKIYHRMIWTSSFLVIFSISCLTLYIPEMLHRSEWNNQIIQQSLQKNQLCSSGSNGTYINFIDPDYTSWRALTILLVFQIALGSSAVILLVHAVVYIDDHQVMNDSILLTSIFLACQQVGPYLGNFLAIKMVSSRTNLFGSLHWIGLVAVLFIFSLLLGMFPKYLDYNTKTNCITCSVDATSNKKDLFSILKRILSNKVVLFNYFLSIFFWSALMNFSLQENNYDMAKFSFPDDMLFTNPISMQNIMYILTPITIIVAIVFTASVITRYNLRAFSLALWNTLVPVVLTVLFLILVFIRCSKNEFQDVMEQCKNCGCDKSLYEPVCVPELEKSFFSPCYAGCASISYENGYMVYSNCSCATPYSAHPGACSMYSCYPAWLSKEAVQLTVRALAGGAWLTHIITTLYLVHFSERPYALGLHIAGIGLIGSGPVRSIYRILAALACHYTSSQHTCLLHQPISFGRYSLTFTIALLLLSSFCGLIMMILIRRQSSVCPDCFVLCKRLREQNRTEEGNSNSIEMIVIGPTRRHNTALEYVQDNNEFEDDERIMEDHPDIDCTEGEYYTERTPFLRVQETSF